jgi:hypothetical protein
MKSKSRKRITSKIKIKSKICLAAAELSPHLSLALNPLPTLTLLFWLFPNSAFPSRTLTAPRRRYTISLCPFTLSSESRLMSALRRVDAREAGPNAVGILLPPGNRTVLILRPRSVPWDLLLVRSGESGEAGTPFLHLDQEEAQAMAEGLCRALGRWSSGGPGAIDAAPAPDGEGFWVQAEIGAFPLIVCHRRPGQAYRPATFATVAEAETTANALTAALCPGTELEVYFNSRHFER